ncbi:MAG: hypothetical protein ACXVCP_03360 [Bdellovibrio sp.]
MKRTVFVKGFVSTLAVVSAFSSVSFGSHESSRGVREEVKSECGKYTQDAQNEESSTLNRVLMAAYGQNCITMNRSAKEAEVQSAFGAAPALTLRQCVEALNDACSSTLGYNWKVSDMYPDAKCSILKSKSGTKDDVLVLYSTDHDMISAFPVSAANQKCGQLQMTTPRLTSVAKFGEKLAFTAGGRLFELHNVTTPSGTGTLVVNEIKNQDKKSYSTLVKVEESPYEDRVTAVRNNNQVITIKEEDLTVSSGRKVKVGNANVERAKSLEVKIVAE